MYKEFYQFSEKTTRKVSNNAFYLHSHNTYEIYMFLEGEAEYIVEEKVYTLSPGDIIIIKKHEMHRVHILGNKKYHRIVFMLEPDFFVSNNIPELENIFLKSSNKTGNKINADEARACGLYDAIMRFKKYNTASEPSSAVVAKSVLIEFLYLLSGVSDLEYTHTANKNLADIIIYLNNNFTDNITLDFLCDKFFVSKYYLCHIFKEATGLTVQKYIKEKRLVRALELKNSGMTLTEAALRSGFDNYSSFFRVFTKRYNSNPTNFKE